MNRTYGLVAAGLLVVGIALVAAGVGLTLQEEARVADRAQTNGTVLSSDVEPVAGSDEYRPNVTYRYSVAGTTYTRDTVYPPTLEGEGSREWARSIADEYQPGDSVPVTYDRASPGNAYIRERRSPGPIIGLGFGMVALAFAFLFGVAAWQEERPVTPADGDSNVDTETGGGGNGASAGIPESTQGAESEPDNETVEESGGTNPDE